MKRSYLPISTWTIALCLLLSAGTAWSAPRKKGAAKASETQEVPAPVEPAPSPEAMKEAQKLFATVCVMCHGASGHGDGVAAAALTPKPRDFTTGDWQKGTKNDAIEKIILVGGAAMGKSPVMPANPQLKDKPDVIAALRTIIRQFAAH